MIENFNLPISLENKIILLTGASRGLGRAIAFALAKAGASLILISRNIAQLETLSDEMVNLGYSTPALYPLDLAGATPGDYETLTDTIMENYGRLDGLIHNAAMLGPLTPLEHYPIESWYQVLQVNLNSAFLLTQATIPALKQSRCASIIFTTADVGQVSRAYWGAYAISKRGCEGLVQILADEFRGHWPIRVNGINPGAARTQLRAEAYPAEDKQALPLPKTLTSIYIYLMSDESQDITGQFLEVQKKTSVKI